VEEMAESQGIKSLKITGRNKQPIHPADWIAGVDYTAEDNNDPDDNDDEFREDERDDDYQEDAELDDEEAYDRVDQNKIDELLAEQGVDTNQEANPTVRDEPEQAEDAVMPGVQDEPIVSD
jgi:hypothetical protein